jgi:2-keto-4-pentenoate hydratase/2-oxohepta-3-ene-1,7-dioic acid hydratase in catechol pathway
MKLASFRTPGGPSWGAIEGDRALDLMEVSGHPTLQSAIAADELHKIDDWKAGAPALPMSNLQWLPVVPNPGKILCIGHNYESHRKETGRAATSHPSIFVRFADSQVGHDQPIVCPAQSTMLDYEGELAVIIGRHCREVAAQDALQAVAGYSIYNDASVRDWQWHTTQFTPGKNFADTGAFGPWLVTADEIPDPSALRVTTRLDGVVMQDQPTSEMIFSVPTIIAYISQFTSLAPGDVIVSGTPGGVGAKREPPVWMKPGDIVEVEIPAIGTLRNPIAPARG